MTSRRADLLRRWLGKVESFPAEPSACWVWTGKRNVGYGMMMVGSKQVYSHRVALELAGRPCPEGFETDHLCRNKACVRPSHLEAVTHRENVLRGISPMAENARKTRCPQGHAYVEGNIHRRRARPNERECLTCHRASVRRSKRRRQQGVRHE